MRGLEASDAAAEYARVAENNRTSDVGLVNISGFVKIAET